MQNKANINIKEEIEKFHRNNPNALDYYENTINSFINDLTKENFTISNDNLKLIEHSILNIKKALNNDLLNTFSSKAFLKLWIKDFLNY